jgi:hypothetical protein
MKELDYGKGYRYAHDEEKKSPTWTCLPDAPSSLKKWYAAATSNPPRKAAKNNCHQSPASYSEELRSGTASSRKTSAKRFPIEQTLPAIWTKIWGMSEAELGGKRSFTMDYETYDDFADPQNMQVSVHLGLAPAAK